MPISDSSIVALSALELQWYAVMLEGDREAASNNKIEEIEYLAAYINPNAVVKVQESRQIKEAAPPENSEVFNKQVEKLFGREMPAVQNRG